MADLLLLLLLLLGSLPRVDMDNMTQEYQSLPPPPPPSITFFLPFLSLRLRYFSDSV